MSLQFSRVPLLRTFQPVAQFRVACAAGGRVSAVASLAGRACLTRAIAQVALLCVSRPHAETVRRQDSEPSVRCRTAGDPATPGISVRVFFLCSHTELRPGSAEHRPRRDEA